MATLNLRWNFLCFPCLFPVFFAHKNTIFYFVNGLHHLLNHNLNLKIILVLCFPCVFIEFLNFPNNQSACFPCEVATLNKELTWCCRTGGAGPDRSTNHVDPPSGLAGPDICKIEIGDWWKLLVIRDIQYKLTTQCVIQSLLGMGQLVFNHKIIILLIILSVFEISFEASQTES